MVAHCRCDVYGRRRGCRCVTRRTATSRRSRRHKLRRSCSTPPPAPTTLTALPCRELQLGAHTRNDAVLVDQRGDGGATRSSDITASARFRQPARTTAYVLGRKGQLDWQHSNGRTVDRGYPASGVAGPQTRALTQNDRRWPLVVRGSCTRG